MSYIQLLYIIPLILFSLSIYFIIIHSQILYSFQNTLEKRKATIISDEYKEYGKYKIIIKIDSIDDNQTLELDYMPQKGDKIDVYINPNDLSNIFTPNVMVKSILYIIASVIVFLISCFLFFLKIKIKRVIPARSP